VPRWISSSRLQSEIYGRRAHLWASSHVGFFMLMTFYEVIN
jgi:hypothetical protein